MEEERGGEEDRDPGNITNRSDSRAAECHSNRVEIAHYLTGGSGVGGHHLPQDLGRDQSIEPLSDADEKAIAHHVEHRECSKRKSKGESDEQKRRLSTSWNDAIVDLQHVEGRREIKEIDEQAETSSCNEMPSAPGHAVGNHGRKVDAENLHRVAFSFVAVRRSYPFGICSPFPRR